VQTTARADHLSAELGQLQQQLDQDSDKAEIRRLRQQLQEEQEMVDVLRQQHDKLVQQQQQQQLQQQQQQHGMLSLSSSSSLMAGGESGASSLTASGSYSTSDPEDLHALQQRVGTLTQMLRESDQKERFLEQKVEALQAEIKNLQQTAGNTVDLQYLKNVVQQYMVTLDPEKMDVVVAGAFKMSTKELDDIRERRAKSHKTGMNRMLGSLGGVLKIPGAAGSHSAQNSPSHS
jgi:hypothetical protein